MPPPSRKPEVLALLPELKEIASKPGPRGTVEYLAEQTGMWKTTICTHLRTLKAEDAVHIGGWRRTEGMPAAVWAKGPGKDAPMPPALTSTQYSRLHRKNVAKAIEKARAGRRYPDRYASHVALALAEDLAARTRVNPQRWFSPLGLAA